jgi:desulfoferrodoxin-like iron-binding protein
MLRFVTFTRSVETVDLSPPTERRTDFAIRPMTNRPPHLHLRTIALRDTPTIRRSVMTRKADVHKCEACGCIISVLKGGDGDLTCCGKKMREVTPDEAKKLSFGLARPGAP